jgi:homoserine dehydrogenase
VLLKEFLEIITEKAKMTRSKTERNNELVKKIHSVKSKEKPGKPHDHIHDDGTDLQWNRGKTFADKKYYDYVVSNMFFNMTKSGDRAGDME